MAISVLGAWRAGSRSVEAGECLADAEDELSVDELLLAAYCVTKRSARQAVDLAQGALGELVESGEGVVGEEVAFASSVAEAEADVLGGVGHRRWREQEAVMDAGEQGAVCAAREILLQLGETDEDEGQERFRIPLEIQEDVEMCHHVGVQQVGLVEEEDGVRLVASELLHVGLYGEGQG